jgi:hypothetical protein
MGEQNRVPKLPLEGKVVIEVGRWPYNSTESRNGGEWVYELHVIPQGPTVAIREQEIDFRVTRQRFDYVRKARRGIAEIMSSETIGLHVPPTKMEVEAFAEEYQRQIELGRSICERAERQYFARLETLGV